MTGFLKGTATALITPFTQSGVNFGALEQMIDYQTEGGTDALVILGTTGEPAVYFFFSCAVNCILIPEHRISPPACALPPEGGYAPSILLSSPLIPFSMPCTPISFTLFPTPSSHSHNPHTLPVSGRSETLSPKMRQMSPSSHDRT